MSDKKGTGHLGVDNLPAADTQHGTAESAHSDAGAISGEREAGRPACLPLASPPRLPSKRTLTESLMDSTVARFEATCTVSGGGGGVGGDTAKSTGRSGLGGGSASVASAAIPQAWGVAGGTVDLDARERTAQAWIEAVSGKSCVAYETKQFARNLKSGEVLCSLVNAIRPGTIPHVHEDSQLGFEQMENIDNFLSACCRLGVPPHALVDTADVFEMRDTPRVVECVHALGSVVQVSCPYFAGPHLGVAADPSQVAAIPPAAEDEDNKPSDDGEGIDGNDGGGGGGGGDDDDDDEDGAFGDFWRASVRKGGDAPPQGGQQDGPGTGGDSLLLNMQDVERPRATRRGFTTTVGSITDLDPPSTLSARARKMCPEEMVNSPRALVFNADPVGHPTRSPTLRAAWELDKSNGGSGGRSAWGTDAFPSKRAPKTPSNLSATSSSRLPNLSPTGLWGAGAGTEAAGAGQGAGVSPTSAPDGPNIETASSAPAATAAAAVSSAPRALDKEPEPAGGDGAGSPEATE